VSRSELTKVGGGNGSAVDGPEDAPAGARYSGAAMTKLPLGSVTLDDLVRLAVLESRGTTESPWNAARDPLDEAARVQLRYLTAKLAEARPVLLNEITLWARAIYPLLELAEAGNVRAWGGVPLAARDPYSDTELSGVVDGVLAPEEGVLAGTPGQPFLLVIETKRGVDATDPRPQLFAAILAVLWTRLSRARARAGDDGPVEVFGCFTVSDTWTFVHAEATVRPEGSQPQLGVTLSWSREYTERVEAEAILGVLRWITRRYADRGSPLTTTLAS
jgi:hypothetical protein